MSNILFASQTYTGDLLFPTVSPYKHLFIELFEYDCNSSKQHDDLEHLCIMEKSIGLFPMKMIQMSPVGKKHFYRYEVPLSS